MTALGKIGPEAKKAIPALVKSLADSNLWVREAGALHNKYQEYQVISNA